MCSFLRKARNTKLQFNQNTKLLYTKNIKYISNTLKLQICDCTMKQGRHNINITSSHHIKIRKWVTVMDDDKNDCIAE